jgi:hypothetical protein
MNTLLHLVTTPTDPLLQLKIGDNSVLAVSRLQGTLLHLSTFRMLLDQIRETGPSEFTDMMVLHLVKEVKEVVDWVATGSELLLDFVIDLKDIVCKLLLGIQKKLKFLLN